MNKRLSIALLLLFATASSAQVEPLPTGEVEEEEIRRYAVEIIVFSYQQDVGVGSEVFVPDVVDIEDPFLEEDEAIVFDDSVPEEAEEQPVLRELELVMLSPDELTMVKIHDRMQRLEVYKPLMHFGWVQPTYPEEETPAIELHRFGRPPVGLRGDLTLYLGRYLHLVVNLEMDDKAQPVRFRINEDRILKNGETRYFDHPKFGVLARVTRIEDDEESAPLDSGGELLGRRF